MIRSSVRLKWQGAKASTKAKHAMGQWLFYAAHHILEEATRIVPHDTGTLQASGECSFNFAGNRAQADKAGNVPSPGRAPVVIVGDILKAAVSYDTPYAARLHEHPEYTFGQGREGEWLKRTLQRRGKALRDFLAQQLGLEIGD